MFILFQPPESEMVDISDFPLLLKNLCHALILPHGSCSFVISVLQDWHIVKSQCLSMPIKSISKQLQNPDWRLGPP